MSLQTVSPAQVLAAIALAKRNNVLFPRVGQLSRMVMQGGAAVNEFCSLTVGLNAELESMAAAVGDPAVRAKARDLHQRAIRNEQGAQEELNAVQLRASNNFLFSESKFATAFFEVWTLQQGDRAFWQNTTRQQVNISVTGVDGAKNIVRSVPSFAEEAIPMKDYWTDDVRYPLRDPNNVDAMFAAMANVDLARDAASYADELAFNLLTRPVASGGAFGSMTLTGNKANRVYVPHTRIKAANLPTTNAIVLDATYGTAHYLGAAFVPNTSATAFRKDVFDAAIAYQTSWGGLFGADMEFTGDIFMSPVDVPAIGANLALDGARKSDIAEEIQQNGFSVIQYQGRTFRLVPDATLDGGACYLPMKKKIGVMLLQPSMDSQDVQRNVRENWETRAQGRRMGFYFPQHHRPFGLKITFRS